MGSWNVNDGSDQFTLISLPDSDSTVAFWLDFLMKFIHSNVNWFFHRNWFIVDELPHSLRKWKRADRGIEHLPRIPQHRREYHCHANDMQMSFVCARENEMLRCLLTWRKHMQMSCRYASAAAQWAAQLGNDANACVPFPASGPAHRIHLRPHLHNLIEGGGNGNYANRFGSCCPFLFKMESMGQKRYESSQVVFCLSESILDAVVVVVVVVAR